MVCSVSWIFCIENYTLFAKNDAVIFLQSLYSFFPSFLPPSLDLSFSLLLSSFFPIFFPSFPSFLLSALPNTFHLNLLSMIAGFLPSYWHKKDSSTYYYSVCSRCLVDGYLCHIKEFPVSLYFAKSFYYQRLMLSLFHQYFTWKKILFYISSKASATYHLLLSFHYPGVDFQRMFPAAHGTFTNKQMPQWFDDHRPFFRTLILFVFYI